MEWHQFTYKLKWLIIKTNIFKHTFRVEGFVYVDKFRNPVNYITEKVKWLRTVNVHCRYKDMDKKALEVFHCIYPKYKGCINLY